VEPWDVLKNAKNYNGPHKVIAHPPCERWGRYWSGGPSAKVRRIKGDDNGCFKHALACVRKYGGILEHPEASHAWAWHGLNKPPRSGGWILADDKGGYTCCVAQGKYGHKAQKLTWLYSVGVQLKDLEWGLCPGRSRMDIGYHSKKERKSSKKLYEGGRLSKRERAATPEPFRDLLIEMVNV